MKIAACCITWRRPRLLAQLIECFNRQTYQERELLILDDSGQYPSQPSGDRWRVVSIDRRFRTIGEKRNAAAALVSPDVDAMAVWDDDDIYLPWALAACVNALESSPWAQPRQVLEWTPDGTGWIRQQTFSEKEPYRLAYHGSWSYRRDAFVVCGGYPFSISEDWGLAREMQARFGPSADTICGAFPDPFYVYSRSMSGSWHISERGCNAAVYAKAEDEPLEEVEKLQIGWERDYTAIPIPVEVSKRPW